MATTAAATYGVALDVLWAKFIERAGMYEHQGHSIRYLWRLTVHRHVRPRRQALMNRTPLIPDLCKLVLLYMYEVMTCPFVPSMLLDVLDGKVWRRAIVTKESSWGISIHYMGWASFYDEWLDLPLFATRVLPVDTASAAAFGKKEWTGCKGKVLLTYSAQHRHRWDAHVDYTGMVNRVACRSCCSAFEEDVPLLGCPVCEDDNLLRPNGACLYIS